jgi:hypothetical protein
MSLHTIFGLPFATRPVYMHIQELSSSGTRCVRLPVSHGTSSRPFLSIFLFFFRGLVYVYLYIIHAKY